MNDNSYTVSQVAAAVGATTPRRQDLWLRRLRHWSVLGVLPMIGDRHVGTGHERLYEADTVYLAAVLLEFGDLGMPIGAIKKIATGIQANLRANRENAALWEEAKNPRKELGGGPVWLALMVGVDEETAQEATGFGCNFAHGAGPLTPSFYAEGDTILMRNLTAIFGRVRL